MIDADDEPSTARSSETMRHALGWLQVVGAAVGLVASLALIHDKLRLLQNPDYVPACNVNSVLSCGSVMAEEQAAVFGLPNPLLGLVGFSVVLTLGVLLVSGLRLPGFVWAGLQAGVVAAIAFIGWLVYQSLYVISALCPYCMVVWAVTWPLFLYVTLRNLRAVAPGAEVTRLVGNWHALLLSLGYLAVIAAIILQFGDALLA